LQARARANRTRRARPQCARSRCGGAGGTRRSAGRSSSPRVFPRNRVGRHRTAASAAPHYRSAVHGRPAAAFERGHQIRGNRRPAYEHAEWLFLANGALDWRVDGKRAQAGTRSASPATRRRGATGTPSEARHGQGGCLPGITCRTVRGKIGAVTAGERPAGAYYTHLCAHVLKLDRVFTPRAIACATINFSL